MGIRGMYIQIHNYLRSAGVALDTVLVLLGHVSSAYPTQSTESQNHHHSLRRKYNDITQCGTQAGYEDHQPPYTRNKTIGLKPLYRTNALCTNIGIIKQSEVIDFALHYCTFVNHIMYRHGSIFYLECHYTIVLYIHSTH